MATIMLNAPKTRAGCLRQADALIRLYRKDFAGGGSFGFDLPTMRLNAPAMYGRYKALCERYSMLLR